VKARPKAKRPVSPNWEEGHSPARHHPGGRSVRRKARRRSMLRAVTIDTSEFAALFGGIQALQPAFWRMRLQKCLNLTARSKYLRSTGWRPHFPWQPRVALSDDKPLCVCLPGRNAIYFRGNQGAAAPRAERAHLVNSPDTHGQILLVFRIWLMENEGCASCPLRAKSGMVCRQSSNFVRAFLTSFSNTSYDPVFWLLVCSLPPHRVELRLLQRIIWSTIGTKP
jgi:hypothetical protein